MRKGFLTKDVGSAAHAFFSGAPHKRKSPGRSLTTGGSVRGSTPVSTPIKYQTIVAVRRVKSLQFQAGRNEKNAPTKTDRGEGRWLRRPWGSIRWAKQPSLITGRWPSRLRRHLPSLRRNYTLSSSCCLIRF